MHLFKRLVVASKIKVFMITVVVFVVRHLIVLVLVLSSSLSLSSSLPFIIVWLVVEQLAVDRDEDVKVGVCGLFRKAFSQSGRS